MTSTINSLFDEVKRLATLHGWEMSNGEYAVNRLEDTHQSQTGSYYFELSRWGLDREGDDAQQTIKLRVSDHGSAYCREDISLATTPGGDDHTIDQLNEVLSGEFVADNGY